MFKQAGLDPRKDYPIEVRLAMQQMLLEAFERQYQQAHAKSHFFIADRTPIDLASYLLADVSRQTADHSPKLGLVIAEYVNQCLEVAARHFSVIVLIQPGIRLVEQIDKAPACPAYMEHLNAIQLGLLMDERNLTRRYFMPRRVTNLKERLLALAVSVKSVIDMDLKLREDRLVH